ncbi:MAG: hypothetical protein IMZ69_01785 [Spirochaetes bacterium]|nr:hypothetical protein [Spirochaetota bacterium]
MSDFEYAGRILAGLGIAVVCIIGAVWLGSLARQAWREWKAERKARQEARASRHLTRQVGSGRGKL